MMTGLYSSQCGVRHNTQMCRTDEEMQIKTIAERLREAGYATAGFGKTHWYVGIPDEHDPAKVPNTETSMRGFLIRADARSINPVTNEKGSLIWEADDPEAVSIMARENEGIRTGGENALGYMGLTSHLAPERQREGWLADTIYALAEYKVGNKQEVIRKTMGKLCRHSLNGNFNEVLEWKTGRFVGCPSYIWSAASYLALVYRMIAGMEVSEVGTVSFAPVLPQELGDRFDLTGLKVGEKIINLRVRGNGENVERCRVDGKEVKETCFAHDQGVHEVEIHLK